MMRNHGSGGLGGRGMQKLKFLTTNPNSGRCVRFPTRSVRFADEFAVLGLTPFASKADVKQAYKRLALKYHPDVMKGDKDNLHEKQDIFRDIKSSYERLMDKFEEEEAQQVQMDYHDEYDEWEEWMGFEGGMPVAYNSP